MAETTKPAEVVESVADRARAYREGLIGNQPTNASVVKGEGDAVRVKPATM